MTLLCVARCRPADRGGSREAAPGFRLCWVDLDRMRTHLTDLITLAPDLEAALSRSMTTGGERVSGTPGWSSELNEPAASARWQIHHDMTTTVRLVLNERGWHRYPADDIEPMARWLFNQVEWLAAHESAGERYAETASWPGLARAAIHPNPPRIVKIGPCVMTNCPGVLSAVVRPQDSLLPSAIVCSWWREFAEHESDEDGWHRERRIEEPVLDCGWCRSGLDFAAVEPHSWSSPEWHALGRAMRRAA